VLTMHSLRRPKRVTLLANDERAHRFLVKGGEDLRQDQRIEQGFGVMNKLFAADPEARRRQLALRTYGVMPLTNITGLVEWVDNTLPLKAAIEGVANARLRVTRDDIDKRRMPEPVLPGRRGGPGGPAGGGGAGGGAAPPQPLWELTANNPAATARQTWLEKYLDPSRRDNVHHASTYQHMMRTAQTADVITTWHAVMSHMPIDLMRAHLQGMVLTPEGFLAVRDNFARSLATLTACGYIIGIGDRHLDNFMLDTRDGTVVGIDWGAAFGHGTHALGVPELIPFRMTGQFIGALAPHAALSFLRANMVTALKGLAAPAAKRSLMSA